VNLKQMSKAEREENLHRMIVAHRQQVFDLAAGPFLRVTLFELSAMEPTPVKYPDIFSYTYSTAKRLRNSANHAKNECPASERIG
jgi:hypothetical protein